MGIGVGVQESRSPGGKETAAARAAAKKEAAERAKKRKELEKMLRVAEAAEREAEAALEEARKAVAKVERDYAATRDRLQFLEKQRMDLEGEAHKRSRALNDAANARTQAAQDLDRA
jgi:chromosome segregation ATPase